MRKETETAEQELRRFVENSDYELVGITVHEYEDEGAYISVDMEVGESDDENPFRVK